MRDLSCLFPSAALARRGAMALACAWLHCAVAAERPAVLPDSLAQRLLACTSCHASTSAPDPFFPRIAGKPAGYLYKQLINFREGRRQYPLMTYMIEHLPDAYLKEIADYYAGLHLPAPPLQRIAMDPAALERGRVLVLEGDKALQVPACIACHGERLTGVKPAIAGLAGLPRDYINAQFGNWRNRTRRANAPDCMGLIANRLSPADVAAVSGWIARRPLPADMTPAAAIALPLPLACGSALPESLP
ncbi:c-type cytochrome [Massilia sp. DWR3-1-1]|uniref:c-type cytochrome n=1 Tax=Massilia sp. DWR3-1-1 TaxID=2804559 RepID=UPI003CF5B17C